MDQNFGQFTLICSANGSERAERALQKASLDNQLDFIQGSMEVRKL